jgi:hypothetical protein
MNTQKITVGPVTANLMMALRAIEQARNYYYLATEEMRGTGNNLTDHMTETENSVFDKARDLVEKEIGGNIRTWAFSTEPGNEI